MAFQLRTSHRKDVEIQIKDLVLTGHRLIWGPTRDLTVSYIAMRGVVKGSQTSSDLGAHEQGGGTDAPEAKDILFKRPFPPLCFTTEPSRE